MFSGDEIVDSLTRLGFSHVVWVPDSTLGRWQPELAASAQIRLIPVCREGEAWAVAGGLWLGGATPLVVIQCTGLFESGDALRNILHDYRMPLYALVGYRSYHNQDTLPGDTALVFTEPILQAWQLSYVLIETAEQRPTFEEHCLRCRRENKPGVALIAEGRA